MDMYQSYANLSRQIKDLTEEQSKLKPRIMGYIKRVNEPVRKEYGTFSIVEYPRYEYSARAKKLEAQLKKIQKLERENGKAIKLITESLRFQSK